MSNKNNGFCPICKKDKSLIKSHIVPEGFFKPLYDEKGRALYGSKERNKAHFIQKGMREYLLCRECDGNLGDYDKYGKETILDNKYITSTRIKNVYFIRGIDYNKFKLFHLSVLLRAHYSKKVSKGINLSKQNEKEIHEYVTKNKAPEKYKYPIFAYRLIDGNNNHADGIITYGNHFQTHDGYNVCVFIFGGFAWNYILDDINPKSWHGKDLEQIFLNESGEMIILDYDLRCFEPFYSHQRSIDIISKYEQKKNFQ